MKPEKRCSSCKKVKTRDQFYTAKTKDGLRANCIDCARLTVQRARVAAPAMNDRDWGHMEMDAPEPEPGKVVQCQCGYYALGKDRLALHKLRVHGGVRLTIS